MIKEIAIFSIEDITIKLAIFSMVDKQPLKGNVEVLLLIQQPETFFWEPIDAIRVIIDDSIIEPSIIIDSIIEQAKKYFLWKSINCLKSDFKQHQLHKKFYQQYPKGIAES